MEGLEVSVVIKSEIEKHPEFRLDSEYLNPEAIRIEKIVKSGHHSNLENQFDLIAGPFGSTVTVDSYVELKDFRYIRGKDVINFFFKKDDSVFIDKKLFQSLPQFHLRPNDILITVVGVKFGQVAIVTKDDLPAIFSCKSTLIRAKKDSNSYFLMAYLLSKYGYSLVRRSKRGMAQPGINLLDIEMIPLPIVSKLFEQRIQDCILKSKELINKSEQTYGNAKTLLFETLGLANFQLSQEPVNVKTFSESFGSSGRLDAEYYQIKFEQVVKLIESVNHDRLTNLVEIKKSIEPGSKNYSEEGLPFIRVSDYDKFGISIPDKYLTDEFCKENDELIKKLKPKKETILFSKDGSVGAAYMLRKDADFITSGAILHLTVRDKTKIIPEYLTLALNSKLVQMQAERDAGGSIILHWRVNEIENVVVPVIEFVKQQEIAGLVEESFKLKKQSEHLLEVTKTAVEMAIEQDEETAITYINENVN